MISSSANRVLMIAYHFPPLAGSSGIQRTLRFVQQLPRNGWEPIVLVPHPMAYDRVSDDLMSEIPHRTVVHRAIALDSARHLSIAGRYLSVTAMPDRWASWRLDAVRQGMKLIRRYRPKAIWSTFPIATAHVIGAELHRRTGLPWLADFRDPMAQDDYPTDRAMWSAYKAVEERTVENAQACLFTTPSAVREYRQRYPGRATRMHLLENGFDEEAFVRAEQALKAKPAKQEPRVLLHSGIVYPTERDPHQLLVAIQRLHAAGTIRTGQLVVRFRAAVHDDMIRTLARELGIEAYIELCPPLGYVEALREMLEVDALLVLQASNCNQQVPAKLYEYLRAQRPILALTDPAGDTAEVLRAHRVECIARLDKADEIAALLEDFLSGRVRLFSDRTRVESVSRESRARQLALLMESVT